MMTKRRRRWQKVGQWQCKLREQCVVGHLFGHFPQLHLFHRGIHRTRILHLHHLCGVGGCYATLLQLCHQVNSMQREYKERIIVNLHARFVDDGSQMLAGHSPVRTRAVHFQVLPLLREQWHTSLFSHLCQ